MRLLAFLTIASAAAVQAHTLFSQFYVNGLPQGDGTCLRLPKDPSTATNPLENLDSDDLACGVNGGQGVPRVCPVSSADTVTFEFRLWPDLEKPGSIDISHKGPCAVYMKKVNDPTTDKAAGDGWFKIWEAGYDSSRKKWCTEDLITNKGLLSVKMPSDLAGGYYLLRPELLALHNANAGDPQFYTSCAQIFLSSSGTTLPSTVAIPGYVKAGEASVSMNIYNSPLKLPYIMPGPSVYKSGLKRFAKRASQQTQTIGLAPQNCIANNGNWCGVEVSDYSSESGCWDSGSQCWNQVQKCYDSAPVTGNKGCAAFEKKCTALNNACSNRNFKGPLNKGAILTPKPTKVQVPVPMSTGLAPGSVNKDGGSGNRSNSAGTSATTLSSTARASTTTSTTLTVVSTAASTATTKTHHRYRQGSRKTSK